MIHKPPSNKISVLGGLCRREMRQNKKKRVQRKSGKDRRKTRSYLWRKKNQDSTSLMKWSSQLLKTFCWIATGTPTLQRKTHLVMMQYTCTLSMELMTLFTHHSPRCIRAWINSTLSSLFCTEEEVRSKFSPSAKAFLFSALTVSRLFSFQDFNIIAGKN